MSDTHFHYHISGESKDVAEILHRLMVRESEHISDKLACIEASIERGFKHMANLTEAQVARLEADLNTLGTDIGKAIDDLKAQIANGGDPQPLLDRIDAAATGLENLDLTVKGSDPGSVVTPVPTA
jgi:hypothetical protein